MSKDKKLNNLLGMKDFSEGDFTKKTKTTKRTDVAKDILQENTGKMPVEKPKTKDEVKKKELNNLISLDSYTETELLKDPKKTKRTEVAKDVIQEKAKLGSGERFKKLSGELKKKGAKDPDALAAAIGRKKYGKAKFQELAKKR
jgi:hypothetical protein